MSALALGVFVLLVAYVAVTKRDIQAPHTMHPESLPSGGEIKRLHGEDRSPSWAICKGVGGVGDGVSRAV